MPSMPPNARFVIPAHRETAPFDEWHTIGWCASNNASTSVLPRAAPSRTPQTAAAKRFAGGTVGLAYSLLDEGNVLILARAASAVAAA